MTNPPPPLCALQPAALSVPAVKVDVGGEVVRARGSDGSISMSKNGEPNIPLCGVHDARSQRPKLFLSSFRLDGDKEGGLLLHA